MLTNVIEGIRVVKMQTWEHSFASQIEKYREKEIAALRTAAQFRALAFSLGKYTFGPNLFITIMITIWTGNSVTLSQAIGILSAMIVIQQFMTFLPSLATSLVSNLIAANKRITKTMMTRCHDAKYCQIGGDLAVQLSNLSCSWKSKDVDNTVEADTPGNGPSDKLVS